MESYDVLVAVPAYAFLGIAISLLVAAIGYQLPQVVASWKRHKGHVTRRNKSRLSFVLTCSGFLVLFSFLAFVIVSLQWGQV